MVNFNDLAENTTYYLTFRAENKDEAIDYTFSINGPEEEEETELVFEQPLELTETQVMFKAESADFIDRDAAIAALEPAAEVILAHPEAKILLAGTTATDGTQEARVVLSQNRAKAVKSLLVDEFKIPESQLQTVGLGFEADPFERGKDRDANGNFVETEGAKNRRVIVMDASDPIAQQILNAKE